MQLEITNNAREVTLSPADTDLIRGDMERLLDPLLASYPDDAAQLRVLISDETRPSLVEVALRLTLHGDLIRARETGPAFRPAFQQALREVRRQVLAHKDRHGRDHHLQQREAEAP